MRGKAAVLVTLLAVLASAPGCHVAEPTVNLSPSEWAAELERRHVDRGIVPHPLEITPRIRELAGRVVGGGPPRDQLRRLQLILMDPAVYTFEYDRLETYTADETLSRRRGNCVSFTNLFIALGRSLGIPLRAALVDEPGESRREMGLVVVYSHLVAVLEAPQPPTVTVYDFFQSRRDTRASVVLLDDLAVAAIVASNWSVQALRAGELERARSYAESAVRLGPGLPDAWANLGLVRWRLNDREGAFAALTTGLGVDARRPSLLNNLATIYFDMGRPEDARAALAAANHGLASPYFLLAYGDIEMSRGDTRKALGFYKRAHRLDPTIPEPLLSIARAERALGHERAAARALEKAEKLGVKPQGAGRD